ncbi:MAG: PfkB family carbohydrate kinase [Chitinispirillaceae bacterium]|jgi:1-phosphofructokinase family hexose kinase|nr:PfkB family carbohydrate kinase [Chitinispirillaceae bacterium]
MIYCTLINPVIESIYTVDTLVSGSSLCDVPCQSSPAGAAINVACAVRALGEEVCVIGIIPERNQLGVVQFLESRGIDHRFMMTPGDLPVQVTVIEKSTGLETRISPAASPLPGRIQDEFMRFAASSVVPGDIWCLSGGIPAGFSADVYAGLITHCSAAGAGTFLDTRGEGFRLGVRAKPLVLKPGIAELEEFFGETINGVHHIALKGKNLLDRGVSHVFVPLGSDGMIALHDNDCLLCAPPDDRAPDMAGCTDALMAGILVSWHRRFSFSETCRLAVACGASGAIHEATHAVTRTATRDEIWQLMEEVKITAI